MERVWGGDRLATALGKNLPPGPVIGESWELVDREDAQSIVNAGPHAGLTLHELWMQHRAEVFGAAPDAPRFGITPCGSVAICAMVAASPLAK